MVMRQGLLPVALGFLVGGAVALASGNMLQSLVFGVATFDPLTFVSVGLVIMLVAVTACYLPARRATRVDPMVALRYE
jgi:putative ABC transport system permease protein